MTRPATKLVVVEDEAWTREAIKRFVEQADLGIDVIGEAEDGEDGCHVIRELRPDIVITDMRMPLLDGAGLLSRLEAERPDLQIVVLSGHDDFKYTRQAIRSGAAEYLLKPVDPGQLKQALGRCLEALERKRAQAEGEALVPLAPEMLAVLSDGKRNLAALLNELALRPVRESLSECIRELDRRFAVDARQWQRVYREFLGVLEQFAAMEGRALNDVLSDPRMAERAPSRFCAADVLQTLLICYEEAIERLQAERKARKKVDLQQISEYVRQHYTDAITLETLAHRFYVSKEYLSKMYKLQFGENVTEHIIRLRMEAARSWVLQDDLQIKHIANRVGYEDVSYFHKVFKKHYGVSPAEMRACRQPPARTPDRTDR